MVVMGLSNGQKKRRYGSQQGQVKKLATPAPQLRPLNDYSRAELAAEPEKGGGSSIFLAVAFVVTLLFYLYYYLLLLPGVSALAASPAPELLTHVSAQQLQEFAAGLGVDGLRDYQLVHRSTGLIAPLLFAFTWWNMVRLSGFDLLWGRLMLTLPVAYAFVFIAGGFALDLALADPLGSATALASLLLACRWVLFLLCLLQLAYLGVRLVQGKFEAFSRGELPGQL